MSGGVEFFLIKEMISNSIIFLGSTKFSEQILISLIENKCDIKAIFSIPEKFRISYSKEKVTNTNFADLSKLAKSFSIPFFLVDSEKGKRLIDFKSEIEKLSSKVIIAAGWYYMIPKQIRDIPENGAWGIHASLLPNYAGGAPLVWAMINGEKETGVSLFKMEEGVDDGAIILQEKISIDYDDTIKTLLEKALISSKKILLSALNQKSVKYNPQDKSKIKIYPQRSPEDGEIDWSLDDEKIRNFVRAQTKPYPGAWTKINNKKVIVWDISIEELNNN